MKKIIVLALITFLSAFSQEKTKIISFDPSLRIGLQLPVQFGNTVFAKDFSPSFGYHTSLPLFKIYNFNIVIGYEFQKMNLNNKNRIGNFSHLNINTYQIIVEYPITVNQNLNLIPDVTYGANNLNYKGYITGSIAKQHGNEINIGSRISYYLNQTFSGYFGLHYAHFYNSNLNANQDNQNYFGIGNRIQFSIGIEIH